MLGFGLARFIIMAKDICMGDIYGCSMLLAFCCVRFIIRDQLCCNTFYENITKFVNQNRRLVKVTPCGTLFLLFLSMFCQNC